MLSRLRADIDVSVAMCTYNGEKYLEEQLNSILNQTISLHELVACDDASDDDTVAILEEYEASYPDIVTIHENPENLGVNQNFEKCLRRCSGDAIAISDQDDVWRLEKLEREVKALQQTGASLVFHDSTIVSESLEPLDSLWSRQGYTPGLARDRFRAVRELVHRNFVQGASILLDADFVDLALPIPGECQYDYFLAVVAAVNGTLYDINEELLLYRQHPRQDIGSREGTIMDQFNSSLNLNRHEWHERQARKWRSIWEALNQIEDSRKDTQSRKSVEFVRDKYRYEQNEMTIYDSEITVSKRLATVFGHWRRGWYDTYGPIGQATLLKDLIGSIFLTS